MSLGVRGSNPIWFLVDLAGHAFDDNFYMWVLENTLPYIPAPVYHDPNLNLEWTDPIQFLANGTLPNDIYFEVGKVYRLEFRESNGLQPPSQSDPLIYEVNNYVAAGGGDAPIDTVALASSNQVSNPQFSLVNFNGTYTLSATNPDPIEIAPNWVLELSGTGTVTINKVALNDSNENPSNAPYALQLTLTGWSLDGVFLRQRFEQNGMLWANKFVSSTLTAKLNGPPQSIRATLVDSNGTTLGQVLTVPAVNQEWNEFTGYAELAATTNPDTPPAAYIDYRLIFPQNVDIYVTSIQLVVQEDELQPSFEQDSINRQIDHTFNYYNDKLQYKPIPSFLTGWDFPLNPFQFGETGLTVTTTAGYKCDQTIMYTDSATPLTIARIPETGSLAVTSTQVNQGFYLMQYLSGAQAFELTLSRLSAYINCYQLNNSGAVCRVYMFMSETIGTIPILPTSIGTVNSSGEFTLTAANWVPIPLINGFSRQFTLSGTNEINEVSLSGFDGSSLFGSSTSGNFAIVVTFGVPISGTQVVINSIGLMAGDIATRPAPQSKDEVLRECEYYYEMSYGVGGLVGTAVTENRLSRVMITGISSPFGSGYGLIATPFGVEWKIPKRVNPNFSIYSPTTGIIDTVTLSGTNAGVPHSNEITFPTFFTLAAKSTKAADWTGLTAPGYMFSATVGLVNGSIKFQYTADARLGIV